MRPINSFLALALLLLRAACANDGQYLATMIVTETVYTVCGLELAETVNHGVPHLFSTDIRLANVVVTGVTLQQPTSPTSCYALPTPISSLEMVALSGAEDLLETSGTYPAFFYLGNNATTPQYVGTLLGGSLCLLDISDAASEEGQIALVLPNNQSVVFDSNGIHIYSNGCGSVTSIQISNFTGQILQTEEEVDEASSEANTTGRLQENLLKRADVAETNFTVIVDANKTLHDALWTMNLTFGPSMCDNNLKTTGSSLDRIVWTCQYPGVLSGDAACQAGFNAWINGSDSPSSFSGGPGSAGDFLTFLSPFLNKSGPSLYSLLPQNDPIVQQGLTWLANSAQKVVNDVVDLGGAALCHLLHSGDEYALVLYGAGVLTNYTLGSFVTPAALTLTQTLGVTDTTDPPRVVLPTVSSFPAVTVGSFDEVSFISGLLDESGSLVAGMVAASTVVPAATTTEA